MWFLSFVLLTWCFILIGILVLNHFWVYGINYASSGCILSISCWIWFAVVLLRTFVSINHEYWLLFTFLFFCGILCIKVILASENVSGMFSPFWFFWRVWIGLASFLYSLVKCMGQWSHFILDFSLLGEFNYLISLFVIDMFRFSIWNRFDTLCVSRIFFYFI